MFYLSIDLICVVFRYLSVLFLNIFKHFLGQARRNRSNSNGQNRNNRFGKVSNRQRSKSETELYNKILSEVISNNSEKVSFEDVIGLENVKQALFESVILPAQRPDIFTGVRAPPRGILLFGPPGNGKTFVAKALASECNSTFFCISASSLTSRYGMFFCI